MRVFSLFLHIFPSICPLEVGLKCRPLSWPPGLYSPRWFYGRLALYLVLVELAVCKDGIRTAKEHGLPISKRRVGRVGSSLVFPNFAAANLPGGGECETKRMLLGNGLQTEKSVFRKSRGTVQ